MSSYYNKSSTMKAGKTNYKAKPRPKAKTKKKSKPIKSRGMGYVVKDIIKRVTRGGLETDARTKKKVRQAGG